MTITPIQLSAWELRDRGKPFVPLTPPPGSCYTHAGHARHYGGPNRRGFVANVIVLHTTESPGATLDGSLRYDARRPDQVSATAIVGEQGIGYDVPEECRAFTNARFTDVTLTCEIIATAGWSTAEWRSRGRTLEHVAVLLADWSRRHSIPLRWLTPAQLLAGESGVCDHLICNEAAWLEDPSRRGRSPFTHTDTGPGLRALVPELLARATEILAPPEPTPLPTEPDAMQIIRPWDGLSPDLAEFARTGHVCSWIRTTTRRAELIADGASTEPKAGDAWPVTRATLGRLTLVGPAPTYPAGYTGSRTTAADFAQ